MGNRDTDPKGKKPDFQKWEQYMITASLAFILQYLLRLVDALQGYVASVFGLNIPRQIYVVVIFTVLFIILSRVISYLWDKVPEFWEGFIKWSRTPNPKYIHLNSGFIHDNVFTLKVRCTEWRYPFHLVEVQVSTPVLYARSDMHRMREYFSFRLTNNKSMRVHKTYEVDLIQFNIEKNLFWLKADNIEDEKFPFSGKLTQQINVDVVFVGHGRKLISASRVFTVKTTFRNPQQISSEIITDKVPVMMIEASDD